MIMHRLMTWLFGAFLLLLREDTFAPGLLDDYHLILENDPQFQAAIQEHETGRQYCAPGRAALLPRLVYSYNRGYSRSDMTQVTIHGDFKKDHDYDNCVPTLSLQQSLFDYETFNRYRKGAAQVLLSDERFRSQNRELLVRVPEAYTGASLVQDQIELTRVQKHSYREQLQLNQRQSERGNGARTDILETQVRFNLAQVQEIEARDSWDVALCELKQLAGAPLEIADLAPFSERFQVRPLSPAGYTVWRDLALAENPKLASLRYVVDVARHEVGQNCADFLPCLDLYASTGKSKPGSRNTYNQHHETGSVNVQLNVPLFSGGETLAATRQATHRMERSHYDLDDKVREALNQTCKMYDQDSSNATEVRAYKVAVGSARTLVMATYKSIVAGVWVNLDLLNAGQMLYNTMSELSRAKYDYLAAQARLRFYAGVLNETGLEQVAANFVSGEATRIYNGRSCSDDQIFYYNLEKIKTLEKLYILILKGVEVMYDSVSDMSRFITVAESVTFIEATKKLGVAKSSTSYHMAVLKKRLDTELLGGGKRTTLTGEGAVYYERAVKVLGEIKSIGESIENSYSNLKGVIKVSTPVTFSERISPVLSSFAIQHPYVFLDVDSTDKHASFREEDYSVAIRVGVNTDHSLIMRKVARNSIYMRASPAYIKFHGIPVALYDLKDHDDVLYKSRLVQGGRRTGFDGRDGLFKVRSRLISDNALIILSVTLDGIDISLLPQSLVRNFIKGNHLARVLSDYIIDAGDVSVAYGAMYGDNVRVKVLANFLVKEIERITMSGRRVKYSGVVNQLVVRCFYGSSV